MTDVRDDPLDELVLVRSLRLDADERPPRLDLAALQRAPQRSAAEGVLAALRAAALVGASVAAAVTLALALPGWLGAIDLSGLLALAIDAVAATAATLGPLSAPLADPSVAVATLAAVLFGAVHERAGREAVRVRAA